MSGRDAKDLNNNWLDSWHEAPIDPQQPIVDAHYHLWDGTHGQPYLLPQYLADRDTGHRIVESIYVECGWGYWTSGAVHLRSTGELEAVKHQYATHTPMALASAHIVAFADLRLGDNVQEVLDPLMSVAGVHLCGIRNAVAFDEDPGVPRARTNPPSGLLADRQFRSGVRRLGRAGLACDIWLYHPQIPELAEIAAAIPTCKFVLNHLGGLLAIGRYGDIQSEVFESWRHHIAALKPLQNVFLKLGGIGIPFLGHPPNYDQPPPTSAMIAERWSHHLIFAIEELGPQRCMFESNFPVDRSSMSFCTTWNAFKRVASGFSPWERDQLFFSTAAHVYGLEPYLTGIGGEPADLSAHGDI